jgi:hypothetical protein
VQAPNAAFVNTRPTPCLLRSEDSIYFPYPNRITGFLANKRCYPVSKSRMEGKELTVIFSVRAVESKIKEPRSVSVRQDRCRRRPASPFQPSSSATCYATRPVHVLFVFLWKPKFRNTEYGMQSLNSNHYIYRYRNSKYKMIPTGEMMQGSYYIVNGHVRNRYSYRCWSVRTSGTGPVCVDVGSKTLVSLI